MPSAVTLEEGTGGSRRQSRHRPRPSTAALPSFRVQQTILRGPARLLRALALPEDIREPAIAAWVESELQQNDWTVALAWIRNNREKVLAAAVDELILLRDRWVQRDEDAEAAVARLNRVYEECRAEKEAVVQSNQ